jgi:DNA-3-methyladenine glycosylase I
LKIEVAILSARAYLAVQERTTLSGLVWAHLPNGPIINRYQRHGDVPAVTVISTALSKSLKGEGFRFVGPTTMYAFMQSVGMVNDHLTTCHRHGPCTTIQAAFSRPL